MVFRVQKKNKKRRPRKDLSFLERPKKHPSSMALILSKKNKKRHLKKFKLIKRS